MFWTRNDFHSLKSKVDTMSVDGNWVSPWVNVSVVGSCAPRVWQRDRWLLAIHLHYQTSFFLRMKKKLWKIQLYSSTIWICFIRTLQVLILKWLHFCILKLAVCCQKYTNLVSTGGMEIVHIINHRYYCYERIRDPSRIGSRADTCWYIHVILN